MQLIDFVGNVATIVTILSFLTGTLICRDIYRARSAITFSSVPFCVGAFCMFNWLRYSIVIGDTTMLFVNAIGFTLQLCYLVWFYIYSPIKSPINRRFATLFIVLFGVNAYTSIAADPAAFIGPLASVSSLLFCASPLSSIGSVMRTRSTESLPFPLIVSSFIVSGLWFVYGYLVRNLYVQMPNAIGALISALQLSLFVIFPSAPTIAKSKTTMTESITRHARKEFDYLPRTLPRTLIQMGYNYEKVADQVSASDDDAAPDSDQFRLLPHTHFVENENENRKIAESNNATLDI